MTLQALNIFYDKVRETTDILGLNFHIFLLQYITFRWFQTMVENIFETPFPKKTSGGLLLYQFYK